MTPVWRSRAVLIACLAGFAWACATPPVASTALSRNADAATWSDWANTQRLVITQPRIQPVMAHGAWQAALHELYQEREGRLLFVSEGRLTTRGLRACELVQEAWTHGIERPPGWEDGVAVLQRRLVAARRGWEQAWSVTPPSGLVVAPRLQPWSVRLRAVTLRLQQVSSALDVMLTRNLWRMNVAIGARVEALRRARPAVPAWAFPDTVSPLTLVDGMMPAADGYDALRQAYVRYVDLEARGVLTPTGFTLGLSEGDTHEDVARLRARLVAEGFHRAKTAADTTVFDAETSASLRRFQHTRGLALTGRVDRATRRAFQRLPEDLIRELELGLVRWHATSARGLGRHIRVNIPRYEVQLLEGGEVQHRWPAMVGRGDRQTPLRRMTLKRIVLYPTWFGRGEIRPIGPGRRNPLGRLVMRPKRPTDLIYIHGTNEPHLFSRPYRAYSRGCIRMAAPEELAALLLDDDPGPELGDSLEGLLARHKLTRMELREPVDLVLDYNTTYVSGDGSQIFFARDIYRRNGVELAALGDAVTALSSWGSVTSTLVADGR